MKFTKFGTCALALLLSIHNPFFSSKTLAQTTIDQLYALLKIRQAELKRAQAIGGDPSAENAGGIVVAERQILDSALPKVTPASEAFTTEELLGEGSLGYLKAESRILIYEGVKQITRSIQDKIPNASTIVIYNDEVLNSLLAVQEYEILLDLLIKDYGFVLSELSTKQPSDRELGVLGGTQILRLPEVATAVTRSIIDFLALFRTDVDIEAVQFAAKDELEQNILVVSVANNLNKNKKVKVYFPSLYAPDFAVINNSPSDSTFFRIEAKRDQLRSLNQTAKQRFEKSAGLSAEQKLALNGLSRQVDFLLDFGNMPQIQRGYTALDLLNN